MTLADPVTGELAPPTFEWPAGVHPAADLFPMMDPLSFEKLVDGIRDHGQRVPAIVLSDGRLLDGRNRVAACQVIGIDPVTERFDGDDPFQYVLDLNLNRRDLTAGQKAAIALDMMPMLAEEARGRMSAGGGDKKSGVAPGPHPIENPTRARDEAGERVGVNGRTVAAAQRVRDEDPDLFEKVKDGSVSVKAAEREVATRFKSSTQKLVAAAEKHREPGPKSPEAIAARVEKVREMAASGHTVAQISAEIGVVEERVRHYAKQYGISFPADVAKGAHRHDSNRILTETVQTLDGLAIGVTLIDYAALDRSQIEQWVSSLSASLKSLTTVKNNLNKELTRD